MKESNGKSPKKESAFSRLMTYAGSYKSFSYASVIMSAVSAVLALFPFIYLWEIIKEVIEVSPDFSRADGIVHNGVMAVVMALVSMLIYFAALFFSHRAAFRVAANMKLTALNHVKKLPVGAVDSLGSGRMRKIISESEEATETYLAHQLPDTANAMLTPVALIVMLFIFDWKLGLVSLIPAVLAFVSMAGMLGKKMAEDVRHYQNSLEDMNNQAVEYVRGMPVVKTFGQSVFTFKKFRDSISSYSKFCMSYTKRCRRPMVLFEVSINSVFAFLTCAALIVTAGGTVTDKFVVNLLFYIIFTPIVSTTFAKIMFMSENNMLVEDALTRVQSILDMEPLKESDGDKSVRDYSIELKNVSFRYEGAERDAVSDLSLKIPQGSHVAFVGPSGGETQRIAIARALLKDAPIVILDEATAFADPENESLVQKAFDEIGKNKTVIMIAHRLSTVKDADEIFVLKEGRLVQSGSHEELLAAGEKDNSYKKMWDEYRKSVTWKVGGVV